MDGTLLVLNGRDFACSKWTGRAFARSLPFYWSIRFFRLPMDGLCSPNGRAEHWPRLHGRDEETPLSKLLSKISNFKEGPFEPSPSLIIHETLAFEIDYCSPGFVCSVFKEPFKKFYHAIGLDILCCCVLFFYFHSSLFSFVIRPLSQRKAIHHHSFLKANLQI